MNPLFQGKIDNFCAAYSVLNAFRLLFGISAFQARDMLNATFIEQARHSDTWKKIVCHETTYYDLVAGRLENGKANLAYSYYCPFPAKDFNMSRIRSFSPEVDIDTVWNFLQNIIDTDPSSIKPVTAVLRFCRFMPNQIGPIVDHWSTIMRVTDKEIYLYDCSLEPTGWYVLHRGKFFSAPFGAVPPQRTALEQQYMLNLASEEFGVICPESIFVVEKKNSPFETFASAFKRKIFDI